MLLFSEPSIRSVTVSSIVLASVSSIICSIIYITFLLIRVSNTPKSYLEFEKSKITESARNTQRSKFIDQ